MKKDYKSLGKFKVVSGVLRISDPCYDRATWCAGFVSNARKGTWKASIWYSDEGAWGERCAELIVRHEDYPRSRFQEEPLDIAVGVDSGQAGIFDDKYYRVDYKKPYKMVGYREYEKSSEKPETTTDWYKICCDKTLSNVGAGVINYGAVSSSGFGDGEYQAFAAYNNNKEIVGIKIVFINEDDRYYQ